MVVARFQQADMAAADVEAPMEDLGDRDKDTECSICHELFTQPKLLPCADVLCRQCLLNWLTNGKPDCPLCRCSILDVNYKRRRQRETGRSW
jgi:hypothetical protein